MGLPIGQLDKTLLRSYCNAPHGWSSQIFVGLLNFVSQRWQRLGFIFSTKNCAIFDGCKKEREIITSLKLAIKKGRITVHWKMPGTYLMTLDECPVIHLTTQQQRLATKNSNWGGNFTSQLLNFPLTNKVCQRCCMLIYAPKRCAIPLKETEINIYHLAKIHGRHFHEKYHWVKCGDGLVFLLRFSTSLLSHFSFSLCQRASLLNDDPDVLKFQRPVLGKWIAPGKRQMHSLLQKSLIFNVFSWKGFFFWEKVKSR